MTELRAHLIWLALTVKGSPPASLVILTVYLNAAGLRTFFFLHTRITINGLQFPQCTAPDSQPVKEGAFPPPGGRNDPVSLTCIHRKQQRKKTAVD